MGLLSFLQRHRESAPAAAPRPPDAPSDAVALARRRARRRLIGATVLLAIGVIGFPLLFETQPRPVAVDIPIHMPSRDGAPPLVLSPAPAATASVDAPPTPADSRPPPVELTERPGEAGRELTPGAAVSQRAAASVAATGQPARPLGGVDPGPRQGSAEPVQASAAQTDAAALRPEPKPEPKPEAKPELKPEAKAEPRRDARPEPKALADDKAAAGHKPAAPSPPPPSPGSATESARAQALLEGRPLPAAPTAAADAPGARVVVQVGAYIDSEKLRQVRAKLEQMGHKTYTQVVESNGEQRTRVRIGPFASRAEADKAAARIKAAGLPAAILAL